MFREINMLSLFSPLFYVKIFIFSFGIGVLIGNGLVTLPEIVEFYKNFFSLLIKTKNKKNLVDSIKTV